ncbi:MAG: endo alpha-1,4 polygalactosaminidase [Verrucomicrobiales bacterium]|nr:endo alpha-1,4 polygalactosaminidase [Verrucomicrobiales bacterium]
MRIQNAFVVIALWFAVSLEATAKSLYVDYSAKPDPVELTRHDVCILHPDQQSSLVEGQAQGNQYYAYLSLAEISPDATYLSKATEAGVKLLAENPEWKSRLVDIRDPAWADFFVNVLANEAVSRGFDGFFIDTVDSIELLGLPQDSDEFIAYQTAIYTILTRLKQTYPTKKIIINRGFKVIEKLSDVVNGVMIESVFSTSDINGSKTIPVEWDTTEILVSEIERIQHLGFETFVVDYVAPGDRDAAMEAEKRIRSLGCIPFVGSRNLDGTKILEKSIKRKLLVLYGYDPVENEDDPIFPGDTLALSKIQTPLEWMGYEFEYHNISKGLPDRWNDSEHRGIIIDESLTVPRNLEMQLATWLAEKISKQNKILFLGTGGFTSTIAKKTLFAPLGITQRGRIPRASKAAGKVVATKIDPEFTNYEIKTEASKEAFEAFQAPPKSRVVVGLQMKTFHGEIVHYDPVFLADWGGCLLPPYLNYQVSPEIDLSHVDPFKFLSQIWPDDFPVPDVTTRQGLRAFYSHIDGDGFVSVANFPDRPICGEVLRDKVLKDLPFPITVSIVEAEIRGHMLTQKNPDVERHEQVSKDIFEMPHVEPASHSYSHPYVWDMSDKSYYGEYSSLNLPLKLTTMYPKIKLDREIGGSLDYVREKLSGNDNPPKIFLWSGNCRPSTEALRLVREAGVENMNGGNTILSRRFPGLSAVAPKLIAAEGEMQVFASNQNEFYYTDGWKGPFFHGFKNVIETFEMTESPRRLKPVNVYYHFYSAERQDALSALHEIYDWCKIHDLHLMETSKYAKMVRDSFYTKVSELAPIKWRFKNQGIQQTYRIPVSRGFPDMVESKGVIGYTEFQDSWYITTDNSGDIVIALSEDEKIHPHLLSSTEELICDKIDTNTVTLKNTSTIRPSKVTVAGLGKSEWALATGKNEIKKVQVVDGAHQFTISPGGTATLSRL